MVQASQLVAEVTVKDTASAVADRVTAAMDRMATAEDKVSTGAATSSRQLETAAKQFERLRASVDPAYAAQQRLANAQAQLSRQMQLGVVSEQEAARVQQLLQAQLGLGGGAFSKYGFAVQNASFQVADFATQIAGGTSPVRALSQQLPQLLGGFGLVGAALSAVVAIGGAVAQSYFGMGSAAEKAKEQQDAFNKTLDRATELFKDVRKEANLTADALAASGRNLAATAAAAVAEAQRQLDAAPKFSGGLAAQGFAAASGKGANSAAFDAARRAQLLAYLQQTQIDAQIGKYGDQFAEMGSTHPNQYAAEKKSIDDLIASQQRELDLLKMSEAQRTVAAAVDRDLASLDKTRTTASQELIGKLTALEQAQYNQSQANKAAAEDERQAIQRKKDQQQAADDFAKSLRSLQDRLDPVGAAQRSLNQDLVTLDLALDEGKLSLNDYNKAVDDLYKSYQDKLDPTGAAFDKLKQSQDQQVASLQAQISTLGEATGTRDAYLAGLQAENTLTAQNLPLSDARSKAYIEQARHISEMNDELKRQQTIAQELPNFFDQAFDRIGSAITQATATGQIGFANLLDVARAVVSEIEQEFIKLALLNPLKNWINGGDSLPTLFNLFGSGISSGIAAQNGHASGGKVLGGVPIMVGEQGAEIWTPPANGSIVPNYAINNQTPPIVVNVEVNATGGTQQQNADLADQTGRAVERAVNDAIDKRLGVQMRKGNALNPGVTVG